MFYYAGLVLVIFWLFHILIIFWGTVFPFHAKNFEMKGYFRYIHIIMAVTGISLPWASVGAIIGTGKLTVPQVPPFVCLSMNSDANIYLFLLPLSIMTATGISLITIILSVIIIKVRNSRLQPIVTESVLRSNSLSFCCISVLTVLHANQIKVGSRCVNICMPRKVVCVCSLGLHRTVY